MGGGSTRGGLPTQATVVPGSLQDGMGIRLGPPVFAGPQESDYYALVARMKGKVPTSQTCLACLKFITIQDLVRTVAFVCVLKEKKPFFYSVCFSYKLNDYYKFY